jgi:glycosyltransferase involved in cell wall biosynthesis
LAGSATSLDGVVALMAAVDPGIVKRVRASKARRRSSLRRYCERPQVALVVHSFNRVGNVEHLAKRLTALGHELIVCDDGSLDGSRERWMSHLRRPNDFLIHSNDLHEIRILDRAIRFSSAEIVCLVQDDDQIPTGSEWLDSALGLFCSHERLAIVGGFMGFRSFHPDPVRAQPVWGPAPFEFVHHVNIGPYFVRRDAYEALGGWDYSFSRPGEPGICFESEFCLRAWVKGYEVGYRFVPFKGPAGSYALDGGTMVFSPRARRRNQLRNQDTIYRMYAPHERRIDARVRNANARAHSRGDAAASAVKEERSDAAATTRRGERQ